MNDSTRKEIEKWIQTWEQAGFALDSVKLNELRACGLLSSKSSASE